MRGLVGEGVYRPEFKGTVEIDFTGQACSDSIGRKFFSGVGGQVDFIRGAARSRGGRPIIAVPSTAKKGTQSRIVPQLKQGGKPLTVGTTTTTAVSSVDSAVAAPVVDSTAIEPQPLLREIEPGEGLVIGEVEVDTIALNAAAALLGAPLMTDFAAISLSDQLTPRDEILRRVELADHLAG